MLNHNLPTLDLHGEVASLAKLLIADFIAENYMLGHKQVKIIHGMGSGVLKQAIHDYLATHKLVKTYKLDMFNLGSTIIDLN